LLGKLGAEERVIRGRPIRQVLAHGCLSKAWVGPALNVVCEHGNGRTRRKDRIEKKRAKDGSSVCKVLKGCGCEISIPRRTQSIFQQCKRSGTRSRKPLSDRSSPGGEDEPNGL
jgi:hypothetical protein